jgi:hypothetical protein
MVFHHPLETLLLKKEGQLFARLVSLSLVSLSLFGFSNYHNREIGELEKNKHQKNSCTFYNARNTFVNGNLLIQNMTDRNEA